MIPGQAKQEANPEPQPGVVNIAIVGGGSRCKSLLKFLETNTLRHLHVNIVGVADLSEEGMEE